MILAVLAVLVATLALVLMTLAATRDRARHRHEDRHPPTATAPLPRGFDLGPKDEDGFGGPLHDVLPMHRAVRLATRRFDGKVLNIALLPQPGEDSPLIYRIRILTPSRDVLDIRMDALTGRFLEVRGADLGAARADRKDD